MQQTGKMSHAKMLAVGAVCIALAFMLNQVAIFRMPMGGSITPMSMLFITLAGYWLGPIFGIIAGVSLGLLDTTTGAYIVHPAQYVLDYILGFGALGIAGFFRKMKFGLQIGYVVGVLGRFVMVFLSGLVFFAEFAPEGQHPAVYSALYNLTYIAPEMLVTLAIISLPAMKHAINAVTQSVVQPEVYAQMEAANRGSISATARIATGTVIGAFGGLAFVFAGHLRRIEELAVTQFNTNFIVSDIRSLLGETITEYTETFMVRDARYLSDYWRASGIADYATQLRLTDVHAYVFREIERNSEQIFAFQTVGVIFLAIAAALLISTLITAREQ